MINKIRSRYNDLLLTIARKILTRSAKKQYDKYTRLKTLFEPINNHKGVGIAQGSSSGKEVKSTLSLKKGEEGSYILKKHDKIADSVQSISLTKSDLKLLQMIIEKEEEKW